MPGPEETPAAERPVGRNEEEETPEELSFILKASNPFTVDILHYYRQMLIVKGATDQEIDNLTAVIDEFKAWNEAHPAPEKDPIPGLVAHAKRELDLIESDEAFKDSIIKAIEGFVSFGHSGGSASVAIPLLNALLQFKNISPLTDDPKEWSNVSPNTWQSARNPEAFSSDGGKTYYLLSERDDHKGELPMHKSAEKKA